MKTKYILFTSVLLCLVAFTAKADRVLDAFVSKAGGATMEFSYDMKPVGSVSMNLDGKAKVRGESFHVSSDDYDIWCDGKTMWILDNRTEEALVTDASGNPAAVLGNVRAYFREEGAGTETFRNASYHAVRMKALEGNDYSSLVLYFSSDVLKAAVLKMSDGSVNEFVIRDLRFTESDNSFVFDPKSLGPDWVVTDLR